MADKENFVHWDEFVRQALDAEYADAGALQLIENASLIVTWTTLTYANPNLTFTGLKVVSPISGAIISVTGSILGGVTNGKSLVLENMAYPLESGSVALTVADLGVKVDRAATSIFLGYCNGTNVWFRPNTIIP